MPSDKYKEVRKITEAVVAEQESGVLTSGPFGPSDTWFMYASMILEVFNEFEEEISWRKIEQDALRERAKEAEVERDEARAAIERVRKVVNCSCGRCVAFRGGGMHTNGPCELTPRNLNDALKGAE